MSGRHKNLKAFLLDSVRSFQDLTFSHQGPGWDHRGQPKERKAKRLTNRKRLASVYWILRGRIRSPLFPPGSRMGSQGTTKATKRNMSGRQKNLNDFLLDSMRSSQDLTFQHQDPGWDSKGQQNGRTAKRLTGRKTLATFYRFLWGPIRTSLFPTRTQDGIPRDNHRDEQENVWQVEKPERLFIEFYEVLAGLHFFHQDPGWDPKGQPNGWKGKCLVGRRTLATFYWKLWGRIRTSLFVHQDPGWDPKVRPKR